MLESWCVVWEAVARRAAGCSSSGTWLFGVGTITALGRGVQAQLWSQRNCRVGRRITVAIEAGKGACV